MTLCTVSRPDFSLENSIDGIVCGIDEVGRGPLAGPVIAAAVILPIDISNDILIRINDSKKISKKKIFSIYSGLIDIANIGIGEASIDEIDDLNIHHATLLAMRRASDALIKTLEHPPSLALIDGKFTPKLDYNSQAIIKGDSRSLSIAAASIIAKYHRDKIMKDLANIHPGYGWETNAGYGTAKHIKALDSLGITEHHRRSFSPVSQRIIASH